MSKKLLSKLVSKEVKKKRAVTASKSKVKKWHIVETPYDQRERFKGVSIGYDMRPAAKGYFVFTHRARSKSYSTINKIPDSIIKRIEQTG